VKEIERTKERVIDVIIFSEKPLILNGSPATGLLQ
jgi:hypothetical protein